MKKYIRVYIHWNQICISIQIEKFFSALQCIAYAHEHALLRLFLLQTPLTNNLRCLFVR